MLPRNLTIIFATAVLSLACYLKAERTAAVEPVGDALYLIDRFYVDRVDHRELMEAAMQGVVSRLDPYSEYIGPESYQMFQDAIQQHFAGIGILIERPDGTGPVSVITPLIGTPAYEAGIQPGDQIVAIDGEKAVGLDLPEVSQRLRGPEDTEVTLTVLRGKGTDAQRELEITVTRATIPVESVVGHYRDESNGWVYRLRDDPQIAYIRISTFGERTIGETRAALARLDGDFQALVLDLRGNQGGLLDSAVEMCDMFLDRGRIVSTRGRDGRFERAWHAKPGTVIDADKPMVVLVDTQSASASEIVAACLQDNGRAVVGGERSFGKGTVQNVLSLEAGRSALKLTTARYYRPNGHNIHRVDDAGPEEEWGVSPSPGLAVELDEDARVALLQRWRRAAFPMMVTEAATEAVEPDSAEEEDAPGEGADRSESGEEGEDPEVDENRPAGALEEPEVVSPLQADPQLQRAVEFLKRQRRSAA